MKKRSREPRGLLPQEKQQQSKHYAGSIDSPGLKAKLSAILTSFTGQVSGSLTEKVNALTEPRWRMCIRITEDHLSRMPVDAIKAVLIRYDEKAPDSNAQRLRWRRLCKRWNISSSQGGYSNRPNYRQIQHVQTVGQGNRTAGLLAIKGIAAEAIERFDGEPCEFVFRQIKERVETSLG